MKEACKPGYIRKGLYYSSNVAELKFEPPGPQGMNPLSPYVSS